MKRLSEPGVNDEQILNEIAGRAALSSHPQLQNSLGLVVGQYLNYCHVKGDVSLLEAPIGMDVKLATAMRGHYNNAINGLEFIRKMRESMSPDVCPMCGSFGTSQLDHVAPKEEYPEYAFFSWNLVPACDCNTKKGTRYRGDGIGERVLHPYYDDILRDRLAYLRFYGDVDAPDIEVRVVDRYSNHPAVKYHVDTIIKKTRIKTWAFRQWANLQRAPGNLISGLRYSSGNLTADVLERFMHDELSAADENYQTPNNWTSMLMYGIVSNPTLVEHLTNTANRLRQHAGSVI